MLETETGVSLGLFQFIQSMHLLSKEAKQCFLESMWMCIINTAKPVRFYTQNALVIKAYEDVRC